MDVLRRIKIYDNSEINSASILHVTFKGIIIIIIYCTVSGFASVCNEYVIKKRAHVKFAT